MASLKQFRLPDVGEGLTEAEIVHWHVKVGDAVTQNQTIVDIETAKALVELPSPFAGVVSELLIPEGHNRRRRDADHHHRRSARGVPSAGCGACSATEGESPAIDDLVPSIPAVV